MHHLRAEHEGLVRIEQGLQLSTSLARPRRQRRARRVHVAHSITTLRLRLSYALIARLGQCLCCGRVSAKLRL